MCSRRAIEVIWEMFKLDPIWAMWLGFWLEFSRRIPTRQSRRAGFWKLEWKGTQGMSWRFPQKYLVGSELREMEGWDACTDWTEMG